MLVVYRAVLVVQCAVIVVYCALLVVQCTVLVANAVCGGGGAVVHKAISVSLYS